MLPTRILCPTDFSALSFLALEQAISLAAHFDAELELLHVVPFEPKPSPDLMSLVAPPPPDAVRAGQALAQLFEVVAQRVPARVRVRCAVRIGAPDHEIAEAVAAGSIDWLVIATHDQKGWRRRVFGSVAEAIVRRAKCPVFIIHGPRDEIAPREIAPVGIAFDAVEAEAAAWRTPFPKRS